MRIFDKDYPLKFCNIPHISPVMIVAIMLLTFMPGSTPARGDNAVPYKIGAEDVITVSVARHEELSGEFYIPADGVVNLPGVGRLAVTGKTLDELSREIGQKLSARLRKPEVNVSLKSARMQRVYVIGSVKNPGLYDVKPGWRITEALAASGGIIEGIEVGDCTVAVLHSASGERQNVKLTDALKGDSQTNIAVENGDVITIEARNGISVYVVGKVKNPGLYKLRSDGCGVVEALTLAGGALDDACISRVTVTRTDGSTEVANLAPAILNGQQPPQITIHEGDLVMVPEENARVAVLGYVTEPGFYSMKSGQKMFLTDVLGLAKGAINKQGDMGAIAVIRTINSKQERQMYDLSKFLKSGDAKQNPEIQPGDVVYVPKTGNADWNDILKSVSALGILLLR